MLTAITFLCALPFSVWLLANLLSLLDVESKSSALLRLSVGVLLIAGYLMITHRSLWLPIAAAFICVTFCHATFALWLRTWALGANIHGYEHKPENQVNTENSEVDN